MFNSFLPQNSSAFEVRLEEASQFADFNIAALANLSDPWTIDARYLPWLAFRYAIEIWDDTWAVEKKRAVIADAIELQRIKGTETGLYAYVKLVDANILQVVVPPQLFFASKGLSKDEINAWHRTMPQIRIYFVKERKTAKGFAFAGDNITQIFAMPDIGKALYGRKAIHYDAGVETSLKLIALEDKVQNAKATLIATLVERVSLSGRAGNSFFAGGFSDASSCEAVIKQPEIITWQKDFNYSYETMDISTNTLYPSLKPLDIRQEQISEKWQDAYSFTVSRITNRFFAVKNTADEKLYDCIFLNDKKRAHPKIKGLSFTDVNMLDMPAYNARILIDLQEKRHKRSLYADSGIINHHITMPDNPKKRKNVARALTLSKAMRDRIFASYQTSRQIRFGDSLSLDGTVKFNTRVKNRL